jgi:nucleotide-binding universal stress UspA family protein
MHHQNAILILDSKKTVTYKARWRMFKKILVAFDGSEHARRATKLAGELARMHKDSELWLVCAMDILPAELGKPFIDELITERTHIGTEMLQQAKGIIGKGITIHEELLFGAPAESIMNVANNNDCDLIIMGTRGVGGLKGLLMGSQIQKVISLSDIPVMAVK